MERLCTVYPYRGFESPPLRFISPYQTRAPWAFSGRPAPPGSPQIRVYAATYRTCSSQASIPAWQTSLRWSSKVAHHWPILPAREHHFSLKLKPPSNLPDKQWSPPPPTNASRHTTMLPCTPSSQPFQRQRDRDDRSGNANDQVTGCPLSFTRRLQICHR